MDEGLADFLFITLISALFYQISSLVFDSEHQRPGRIKKSGDGKS